MRIFAIIGVTCCSATLSLAETLPPPATNNDFPNPPVASVLAGRNLFFDPILSGNRNIACATCHHPAFGSSDGVPLAIGEGGIGLGPDRQIDPGNVPISRIPRNAPALFNLGAREFTTMFHDGRVQKDDTVETGVRMPAGFDLERALPSALAAQTILPITSPEEMAGQPGENDIANAAALGRIKGPGGVWDLLAARVELTPGYRRAFDQLIGPDTPVHITDIGRALSDFISYEFRATNSAFDDYLRGKHDALSDAEMRGMDLFYGKAQCDSCHSGAFQTDHQFHALALPQFGPGKGHGPGYADHGRSAVTGEDGDRYKFRTPSLRNVALTAPYGHNGAYATLDSMIRHHLDPIAALSTFDIAAVSLPALETDIQDSAALQDIDEMGAVAAAFDIDIPAISDAEIADLVSFLNALTDKSPLTERLGRPETVPSGLRLDPLPQQ